MKRSLIVVFGVMTVVAALAVLVIGCPTDDKENSGEIDDGLNIINLSLRMKVLGCICIC